MPGMNNGMGGDPIADNMSMMNPTDLTMMAQEKRFTKGMTIGDMLNKFGLTPDDPIEKLAEVGKQQVKNANPLNKAKNMANQASPTPPEGQGGEQGLDSLLQGM